MDPIPHDKGEIDWKDLVRKPEKLFGYSYLYVLAVVVGIGLLYVGNLSTIGKNAVTPTVLKDSSALIKDIPLQSPRVVPPVDVMKVGISSPELVNKGRELFKANCVSCHGDNGRGDGPSASMLNPAPRNFHSLEGWKNGSKVTQMYKTLEEGIPGGAMAAYNYMPPENRFALIHYIRTFASNQPGDSPDDLKHLDETYHLAKGMDVAGQIPIKKAMVLVEKEIAGSDEQVHKTALQISASNQMGAELLKRISSDEIKVVICVSHMKSGVKSVDDFIDVISANPIQCGFNENVVRLSANEWSELYQYLFSVVK